MYKNKSILITGATGSFGKAYIKKLLNQRVQFRRIIIFSRDELKQHEMKVSENFNTRKHKNLRYFIGDVRDKDRLMYALRGVDFVIHAAALKQVDTSEYNPFETIKTNILGAQNIIEASLENNVSKVISLSTDKASSPINLYGASKLCSDKLFVAANSYIGKKNIKFSIVRYGNVMGSRGSVIPVFKEQAKKGIIKITNEEMTRFNITLDESIKLVEWTLKNSYGSEIIVPKIPSYNIMDLAKSICSKCKIKITGIRPGEKLHEEMISFDESANVLSLKKYYIIAQRNNLSQIRYYKKKFNAKKLKNNFRYNSKENRFFLQTSKLRNLIRSLI
jgi:UDP-N-acetylglucosamine 4,6-dehydratase (inverting)